MGITISFIFCLLSGFLAFWLFWKCVIGLRRFKEERKDYVHSIICIRCCSVRVLNVCSGETRKVLKD